MKLGDKIKGSDLITEVFEVYPEIMELYVKKSMHCVGCEIQDFETIEESCLHHNFEVEPFLNEINTIVEKKG